MHSLKCVIIPFFAGTLNIGNNNKYWKQQQEQISTQYNTYITIMASSFIYDAQQRPHVVVSSPLNIMLIQTNIIIIVRSY